MGFTTTTYERLNIYQKPDHAAVQRRFDEAKDGPGYLDISKVPEAYYFASVTEVSGLRLFGLWLWRRERPLRVFRLANSPWWRDMETGEPTEGNQIELLEGAVTARQVAVGNSLAQTLQEL